MSERNQSYVLEQAGRIGRYLDAIREAFDSDVVGLDDYHDAVASMTKINHLSAAVATAIDRGLRAHDDRQRLTDPEAFGRELEEALEKWQGQYGSQESDTPAETTKDDDRKETRMENMTDKDTALDARIEDAFDRAITAKGAMEDAMQVIRDREEAVKLEDDHMSEWISAKNNDIRAVLVAGWLKDDEEWNTARTDYRDNRRDMRVALLEVERLKLLVLERSATSGTGGR